MKKTKLINTAGNPRFDLDLNAMYWFTLIIEHGSFLSVAETLRIPKSTLSRRITNLESKLGSQLLIRNSHAVHLTEFGQHFYSKAKSILETIEESIEVSDREQREIEGTIRIIAGVEFGTEVLSPILSKFVRIHSKIIFDIIFNGGYLGLSQNEFDLAVKVGPLNDSNLVQKHVGDISYGLFASPSYIKNYGMPASWQRLSNHQTLLFTGGHYPNGWKLSDGKRNWILDLKPKMRCDTHWLLKDAAVNGLGICFMPKFMTADEVKKGKLKHILPKVTSQELPINILFPKRKFMPLKIRTAIDFISKEIKDNPNCSING